MIFEDNEPLRRSMKMLLDGVDGYEVVGDYGDGSNASEAVRQLKPDIVIMDIDMPFVNGIEGLRRIKEGRPETAVIMHTVFEDDDKLFDSLCAGANGYLLKNSSFTHLLNALEEVQQGGAPMSPSVATKVLRSFQLREYSEKCVNYLLLLMMLFGFQRGGLGETHNLLIGV